MLNILWRFFPGPKWLRAILSVALLAGIAYLLVAYVYPTVAILLPPPTSTVG